MASVKVFSPSLLVYQYDEARNAEQQAAELDLLEELRLNARLCMINYKQKTKQYHYKRLS